MPVAFATGIGDMDVADKPPWMGSRRPVAEAAGSRALAKQHNHCQAGTSPPACSGSGTSCQ